MSLMTRLIKEEKIFYCPLKRNRQVEDSGGKRAYRAIATLSWIDEELWSGTPVKVKRIYMNKIPLLLNAGR